MTATPSTTASVATAPTGLAAAGVRLAYGDRVVVDGLDFAVPEGQITAIVGPNGCGKSTLLRGLARLLRPAEGHVVLDGQDIASRPTKEVARRIGLLPQSPLVPEGISVAELVSRGRAPHHGLLRQWTRDDDAIIAEALELTHTDDLAHRDVEALSGGQRQRVWIAMVLAQRTGILLLDEPTSFLDIAHQVEVLDLIEDLHRDRGATVVMVLHDLGMAARYAQHLVAMRDGCIVAQGQPAQIVTPALVEDVFGVRCAVLHDDETGAPVVVPRRLVGSTRSRRPLRDTATPAAGPVLCAARVRAIAELPAGVRRITLAAPELARLRRTGPDEYFGLLMPPPGGPLELPDVAETNVRAAVADLPEAVRPSLRWYTVRAHRPERGEIDVDIVTHGDAGPGTTWAHAARVGDEVGFRSGGAQYAGPRPVGPQLFVADETALPALSAILESGDVAADVRIHVEVRDPVSLDGYPLPRSTTVHVRGDAVPGSVLIPALERAELGDVGSSWVCGEAGLASGVRRMLVSAHGLAKESIVFSGYWRLGAERG